MSNFMYSFFLSNAKHKPRKVEHLRRNIFVCVRIKTEPKPKEYLKQENFITTFLPKNLLIYYYYYYYYYFSLNSLLNQTETLLK